MRAESEDGSCRRGDCAKMADLAHVALRFVLMRYCVPNLRSTSVHGHLVSRLVGPETKGKDGSRIWFWPKVKKRSRPNASRTTH